MAFDLTAASDIERVVTQWLKAGRHAAARSAYKLNARPTRGDFLDPTRRRQRRSSRLRRRRVPESTKNGRGTRYLFTYDYNSIFSEILSAALSSVSR